MKQLPDVPAFVIEFFQRLFKRSPKFFRVLNAITGVVTIITGAIPVIAWLCSFVGIIIPPEYQSYGDLAISKLTAVAWVTGQLAIDRSTEKKDPVEVKALPFTVKKELERQVKA